MVGTLILTNDFPPEIGGIEAFVAQLAAGLRGPVVVLTRRMDESAAFDAVQPYDVVRLDSPVLLPTPQLVRTAAAILAEHKLSSVVFGAAAPLGLLAPQLRRAGAQRLVGISHGHEVWWARLPGSSALLRRIVSGVDVLTYISEFTGSAIEAGQRSGSQRAALRRLSPPVEMAEFARITDKTAGSRPPTCLSAGRLIEQKGFDVLLLAWRGVIEQWPHPEQPLLRIAGSGRGLAGRRLAATLVALADGLPVEFVGPLSHAQMPAFLASGDVFASPVRSRWRGLNSEGFGLVFAEAAAAGLPVLVGNSGGAGETVLDGRTGYLLDPRDPRLWADHLSELLLDAARARAWGAAGRGHVGEHFSSQACIAALQAFLDGPG